MDCIICSASNKLGVDCKCCIYEPNNDKNYWLKEWLSQRCQACLMLEEG